MEPNQQTSAAPNTATQGADLYDDMDCRAESAYPEANRDAATPDFIKQALAAKKTDAPPDPAAAPAAKNENPA